MVGTAYALYRLKVTLRCDIKTNKFHIYATATYVIQLKSFFSLSSGEKTNSSAKYEYLFGWLQIKRQIVRGLRTKKLTIETDI